MTEGRGFCPRCGDPVAEEFDAPSGGARGPICRDCYFDDFEPVAVPSALTIRACPSCGAIDLGDGWVDPEDTDITDAAIDAVQNELRIHRRAVDPVWRVTPDHLDANTIALDILVRATVAGEPIETTDRVTVTIDRRQCDRCSLIAGDYFASIVQIRAANRALEESERAAARDIATKTVSKMIETGDRNAFVTDVTEVDDGIDIKVSTTKIGRTIARRMVDRHGGTVDSSETLITTDADGNDVYRVTFAVRLPPFVPGDIIEPGDGAGPVLVSAADDRVRGRRLPSGEPFDAPVDPERATKVADLDSATETTVVTVEDAHAVQVIDPETFESVTVDRPSHFDPTTEMVRVIKLRSGLYIIPDEKST